MIKVYLSASLSFGERKQFRQSGTPMNKRNLSIILLLAVISDTSADGAVFTISNSGDSGYGTFNQAILELNSAGAGANAIEFTAADPEITLFSTPEFIKKPAVIMTNNGGAPLQVNHVTSTANARTLKVTTNVQVSLADELLTLGMQSSSTGSVTLYSADNLIISGNLGSNLLNTSTGSSAYGVYAGGSLSVSGAVSAQTTISSQAAGSVYALYSVGNISVSGELSGSVSANATSGGTAYGIRSGMSKTTTMHLGGGVTSSATITATAVNTVNNTDSTVYGLYSGGTITIGQRGQTTGISGVVSATAGYDTAYGVRGNTVTVHGGVTRTGRITASAGRNNAFALDATTTLDMVGDLCGDISATAMTGGTAYALYAGSALTITGDIAASSTVTASAGSSKAYAIFAEDGPVVINGSVIGTLSATTGTTSAYGISAGSSLDITGDISVGSTVAASAGTGIAYGLHGAAGLTIGGGIGGEVIAKTTKSGGRVYGLYGGSDEGNSLTIIGGIAESGSIMAVGLSGSTACGIYSAGSVTIGRSGGTTGVSGSIVAEAALDDAYGISGNAVTLYGGVGATGSIRADAAESGARGIYSASTLEVNGDIAASSSISASTGTTKAAALYAEGGDLTIRGSVGGELCATAGTSGAYGIYSGSSLTLAGDLSGRIDVFSRKGSKAHALHAGSSLIITGNIAESAKIIASAATTEAYALYAGSGAISVRGVVSGEVSATTGSNNAAGIYAKAGIYGATESDALTVSGMVTAVAKGAAAGIMSEGPMNIFVSGTLSGVDNKNGTLGYAIYSGGFAGSGEFSDSIASDDRVVVAESGMLVGNIALGAGSDMMTMRDSGSVMGDLDFGENDDALLMSGFSSVTGSIVMGSGSDSLIMTGGSMVNGAINFGADSDLLHLMENARVTGDIDFGTGDDTLRLDNGTVLASTVRFDKGDDRIELSGDVDISRSPLIDGGSGDESAGDRIVLSSWNGVITDAFKGWERIEVAGASCVNLDLDDLLRLAPSYGQQLTFMIEAGSTVMATGNSPGRYEIVGNLENSGLLDLRDGEANDRVTVSATYTGGGGSLGLDLALGGGSQNNQDALDLLSVGRVSVAGSGTVLGTTALLVRNISGKGKIKTTTGGNGILVAKVYGTSSSNAFYVDGSSPVFRGANVRVVKVGRDWYLQILSAPSVDTTTDLSDEEVSDYSLDTSVEAIESSGIPEEHRVLQTILPMLERHGAESVPRFRDRQLYYWSRGDHGGQESWWIRTTGSRFLFRAESGGQPAETGGYRSAMQIGSDLKAFRFSNGMMRHGLYAGTGYVKSDIMEEGGVSAGRVDAFTMNIGGYSCVELSGTMFLEGVVQATRYDIDASFKGEAKSSGRFWGFSASLESGLRIGIAGSFFLEPQAQLIWMRLGGFEMQTPSGGVQLHEESSLLARAGLTGKFEPEGLSFSPFFEINTERNSGASSQVTYKESGRSLRVDAERVHVGGAIGIISRNAKRSGIEYSVKTGMMVGIGNSGSREYQLNVALRKSW